VIGAALIYLTFDPIIQVNIPYKWILGILMFVYGIFRGYRVMINQQRLKNEIE
jgi:hypothetical protein